MTSIVYNEYKGFYINSDEDIQFENSIRLTNGISELPWDEYLPNDSIDEDNDITQQENLKPVVNKKMSKSEKREIRQSKRLNAARKKQLKRVSEYNDDQGEVFNAYLAKQEIKKIYKQLMEIKLDGVEYHNDEKLIQYHSIALYKSDIQHFLPNDWLNDNNISIIFELINNLFITKEVKSLSNQIVLLFPSLLQLFMHFPDSTEDLLPMNELKSAKLIFLPINFIDEPVETDLEQDNNGDHWALGILSLLDNKLFLYDSMSIEDDKVSDLQVNKLCKKFEACKGLVSGKIKVINIQCDQQKNFDDCGVFVIMITCFLINQLVFQNEANLDISKIKFNPLDARLQILKILSRLIDCN